MVAEDCVNIPVGLQQVLHKKCSAYLLNEETGFDVASLEANIRSSKASDIIGCLENAVHFTFTRGSVVNFFYISESMHA